MNLKGSRDEYIKEFGGREYKGDGVILISKKQHMKVTN